MTARGRIVLIGAAPAAVPVGAPLNASLHNLALMDEPMVVDQSYPDWDIMLNSSDPTPAITNTRCQRIALRSAR